MYLHGMGPAILHTKKPVAKLEIFVVDEDKNLREERENDLIARRDACGNAYGGGV